MNDNAARAVVAADVWAADAARFADAAHVNVFRRTLFTRAAAYAAAYAADVVATEVAGWNEEPV